jgi:hypothetical protein
MGKQPVTANGACRVRHNGPRSGRGTTSDVSQRNRRWLARLAAGLVLEGEVVPSFLRSGRIVATLAALATVCIVLAGFRLAGGYDDVARRLAAPTRDSDLAGGPPPQPMSTPSTSTIPSQPVSPSSSSAGVGTKLRKLLNRAAVVATRPNAPGYDRGCGPGEGCVFGPEWSDATEAADSHNGCDTRNDVLRRDLVNTAIDSDTHGCVVLSGVLHDPYTGSRISFVRGWDTSVAVQIDHLIPLAAAWDLGAWRWSPAKRATFANDTAHELLAVDGPSNMSKGDSTPASWLPPNKSFRCEYGVRYLRDSIHWRLPITAADAEVLGHVARRCS